VVRISRRWIRRLLDWSRGSLPRRIVAIGLVALVATALSWAWTPRPGLYRPITPGEKGLLTAVLSGPPHAPDSSSSQRVRARPATQMVAGSFAQRRLAAGSPLQATFQTGRSLPTRAHPQLAMVLVPTGGAGHGRTPDGSTGSDGTWVFPFDKPLPPGPGDNQAAAYNTTDGSVKYDVAFALVWATGDEVYNVNEAHAYASCSNCVTVAVAFQVLLIMDNAHVVVPQNLSVAANYNCYRCITAAIASQLVLSVDKTPDDQQLLAIGALWGRLTAFGHSITAYSLTQITAQLDAVKAQIIAILGDAPPVSDETTSTAPPDASPSGQPGQSSSSSTDPPTASTSDSAQAGGAEPSSGSSSSSSSGSSSGDTSSTDAPTTTEPTSTPTPDPTPESPSASTAPTSPSSP